MIFSLEALQAFYENGFTEVDILKLAHQGSIRNLAALPLRIDLAEAGS